MKVAAIRQKEKIALEFTFEELFILVVAVNDYYLGLKAEPRVAGEHVAVVESMVDMMRRLGVTL